MCACRGAGRLMNHGCWFGCNAAAETLFTPTARIIKCSPIRLWAIVWIIPLTRLEYELWSEISVKKKPWGFMWTEQRLSLPSLQFISVAADAAWAFLDSLLFGTNSEHYRWPVIVFQNLLCLFASEQFNVLLFSLGCKQQNSSVMFEEHAAVIKARETSSS